MVLFGVTGGIGVGKSTVCKFLRKKGIPVIEADVLAKDLTNTLPEIRQALIHEFGEEIYLPSGELNREKLSQFVFNDPEKRTRVNRIIHPYVFSEINSRVAQLKSDNHPLIGVEAALIFESQMDRILDAVVVVNAPLNKRIAWLRARDGFDENEILQRMKAQMAIEDKLKRADYIIENSGDLQSLESAVALLIRWLHSRLR